MKNISIIWGTILLFSIPAMAQVYSTKPAAGGRELTVRFHVAQMLLRGPYNAKWSPVQQATLVRTLKDPNDRSLEADSALYFNPTDRSTIFERIGSLNVSQFKTIYQTGVFAEKRDALSSLPDKERGSVWQINFAYWLANHPDASIEKINYLIKLSIVLNNPTKDVLESVGRESKQTLSNGDPLFTQVEGKELFATVGPHSSVGQLCKRKDGASGPAMKATLLDDCICSVGGTNWSCKTTCLPAEDGFECNHTETGCGFLLWYPCVGKCHSSEMEQ